MGLKTATIGRVHGAGADVIESGVFSVDRKIRRFVLTVA